MDIIHSKKIGTDNVQGQILSIFLKSNGSYCVYYTSNIFGNVQNLLKDLKIGEYPRGGGLRYEMDGDARRLA